MTDPQDPIGYGPFSYDPLGRVPPAGPPAQPPAFTPPPAPPHRPPANALATLSLVFAFVFPPAGAILGHLGLAQIRRTGEPGRDRALAGVMLSYAFITLTVLALVTWATLAALPAPSGRNAASPTTTTTAAPSGPTVEPPTVAALLPSVTDLKNITADQNLEAGPTRDRAGRPGAEGTIDRPECWGSIAAGTPDAFTADAIAGYHAAKFSDTRSLLKSVEVVLAVLAFRDPPAAQSQLANALSGWRQCGGSTVTATLSGGPPIHYSVGSLADAGNGITTLDLAPKGLQVRTTRAIGAKANVVVDLAVSCGGTTDAERSRQSAVSIANYVLNKIPG
ncbi:sensor domain-containing protein [Mycobacterium sp. 852002-51057_SCH5723018]|uniref:sensor domain-containing protein n=1 Tax=Mycobacterium sp. 852002-51057_SCH5723018 TaxID=1834094 RepID=UPI0007FD36E3|nr:sensor domain-containing protein [Mycobacterium sp. 852002-51057_SCH5723018]OBG29615.1 nuclease PIN [Mycobacterium sp. 852002-51057_SCH5723018]